MVYNVNKCIRNLFQTNHTTFVYPPLRIKIGDQNETFLVIFIYCVRLIVAAMYLESLSELKPNIKYKARVINSRLKWEGKLSLYYFFKVLGVTAFRVGKREPLTFAYSAIKSTPHISLWLKESLILPEEFESTLIQGQNSKYSHYSMS